ncbi:mitochondrial ornithine carbamoyltransferase [Dichomitus squalens LYAD-421 SS1]|uniref:ornithine carbamoyltransferase n=2 Tax=Dichomitus squalens TaxID=114155 RepID=A0A4Q9MRK9_9APHY|nr:mitochondrial ornithine carbamoyltransferase [Dichomitus squalens LYAD-421 SS1]EJF57714.1 mitochondrial ornithine carbamoyltransferase [Dichomitus squalens LYAD-421 SS1]TBU28796.1 mitochondrial ornithine carbamoyltransferase [Dichomitus squalens]
MAARKAPHLMTLADLSSTQIHGVIAHSFHLKRISLPWLAPQTRLENGKMSNQRLRMPSQSLFNKTVALLFSKRSTRTRLAAETAASLLGGRALFLGKDDIQIGVNESVRDSARVIGGMCQGIFARVGDHSEIEELAQYSPVPVLNALSSLWHPTQVLADLLTLTENAYLFDSSLRSRANKDPYSTKHKQLDELRPLTIAYVGDCANVLNDMLVMYPRLGHKVRVGAPENPKYRPPKAVWDRVVELGCDKGIFMTADPREAVHGADVVITDTWISMGQEAEKEQRLKDFEGYQVTEKLCKEGGANADWKFMHCLPRKQEEVDDEVFYGPRSLVFEESDNRKWTIMAVFDLLFGKWDLVGRKQEAKA